MKTPPPPYRLTVTPGEGTTWYPGTWTTTTINGGSATTSSTTYVLPRPYYSDEDLKRFQDAVRGRGKNVP